MMSRCGVVMGVMVLSLIAGQALAQPQGPGFGPFGMGGFGPGGPGMPATLMSLIGIAEVQKEVGLSDQQVKDVRTLSSESQRQLRSAMSGINFQELQDMSEDERQKMFAEAQGKADGANKQADEKLGKILDKKQLSRLNQLQLQREGVTAISRTEVAKQLDLSKEQIAKIRKIQEQGRAGFGAMVGPGGPGGPDQNPGDFMAGIEQQREKIQADILAALTDPQRTKWAEMKGKEFKFPQPQFGFGPGAFGGPGGPNGPGNPGGPGGANGPGRGPGGPGAPGGAGGPGNSAVAETPANPVKKVEPAGENADSSNLHEFAMQIKESLRDLLWNPEMIAGLPKLILSLGIAALLGMILGQVYIFFGHSMSNRRLFARTFLILVVTTTLIISIVKSSMALSLGLVGALSIVRFRAAIKEPEELAFLFLAISIGLGLGAGQALVTIVALTVILGLIIIRGLFRLRPPQPNLYMTVISPAAAKLGAEQILRTLADVGATASLKRFEQTPELLEASFLVDFKQVARLERFTRQLRELSPDVKVSCLDDRGLIG
ncbi:MAG: DUF4956 domain-containing protein [Thermoguttaceae bacterium]|jgi:uncharacterized membrane protein YhiD involved in acid resistance